MSLSFNFLNFGLLYLAMVMLWTPLPCHAIAIRTTPHSTILSRSIGNPVDRRNAFASSLATLAFTGSSQSLAVPNDGLTFIDTPSGLKYADVRQGKGDQVVGPHSRVTLDLVGRLVGRQGWKFENTRDDDEPYRLQLGNGLVIEGLEEGLQGMRVGGYRRLVLPSRLAYSVPSGRSLEPIPRSFDFQQRLYSTVLNPTRLEQEQNGLIAGEDVTGIVQLDVVVLLIRPPV